MYRFRRVLVLLLVCLTFFYTPLFAEPSSDSEQQQKTQTAMDSDQSRKPQVVAEIEPVVVTATRVETPQSQLTKSVSVATSRERDDQQNYFLPELIDSKPGVYLRRLGGLGQWSNIAIRGAGSQHVQYQYNGFPLRDAADTQTTIQYFVEDLYSASNLKQIEVLKGTQSTLYGSQAMAGVVNIIPEKWKRGTGAEIRGEVGEYNTFLGNGQLYHGQDRFFMDFNPIYVTTDGPKNGGDHGFYYDNLGFTAGAGYRITPDISLEFSSLYTDADLALTKTTPRLDANGKITPNQADPDKHRESLLGQYGLTMNHEVSSVWTYSLKGAYTETQRHYFWSSKDGDHSNYDGSTVYVEAQNNFNITDWLDFLIGLDIERADYDGREPANPLANDYRAVKYKERWYNWDAFSLAGLKFLDESLFINIGARFNDHQKFDSKTVAEASAAYLYKPSGTKFRGQIGTGYRTPSLYEIYGGYLWNGTLITIGNPELEPEESVGYELGVEQAFADGGLKFGLIWFRTDFDNLIIYDVFKNKYANANEARAEGFETFLTVKPWPWLRFEAAYTYTESKYKRTEKDQWIRKEYQPRNKVSGLLTLNLPYDFTASLRGIWVDEKIVPLYDSAFKQVRWEEPSVIVYDAALSYTFMKKYQAYVRVENLFDKDYTESAYIASGRSVFGGLKLTF